MLELYNQSINGSSTMQRIVVKIRQDAVGPLDTGKTPSRDVVVDTVFLAPQPCQQGEMPWHSCVWYRAELDQSALQLLSADPAWYKRKHCCSNGSEGDSFLAINLLLPFQIHRIANNDTSFTIPSRRIPTQPPPTGAGGRGNFHMGQSIMQ